MTMSINVCNNSPDQCNFAVSDKEWDKLKDEIESHLIPKNTVIESRPFEVEDFKGLLDNIKSFFKTLTLFQHLPSEDPAGYPRSRYECICCAIILCGEHSSENLWTDDDCIARSRYTLKSLMSSCKCEALNDFIIKVDHKGNPHGVNLLTFILPKLSKEEWKYYPSITHCFAWFLSHVQLPHMREVIQIALPITLNILDDYSTPSKQIGLRCLHYILINVSTAELQWHIQLELLQNILKRFLYYREYELVFPVINCALEIAEKSQPNMKYTGVNLEWSFYDEILNVALPIMEFEQNIERRQSYGECLCLIAKSVNVSATRWLPRILRIIEDYSKTEITEKEAMIALNSCLRWCWPVINKHWKRINVIAGKIIFSSKNMEAIKEAEKCIFSLKEILPEDTALLDVEAIRSRKR